MDNIKNIKLLRVTRELTQINVYMQTGIDQSTLSKYENSDTFPTTNNLLILAKFYGTSLDYLMDLTDEEKPYPPKRNKK